MHVASNSHFGGFWGCGGLQMTSEATYDLRFELSDLNCLCCHVFLAFKDFCELIQSRPKRTYWPACFAAGKKSIHLDVTSVGQWLSNFQIRRFSERNSQVPQVLLGKHRKIRGLRGLHNFEIMWLHIISLGDLKSNPGTQLAKPKWNKYNSLGDNSSQTFV